jgi:MFS family permease
MTTLTQTTAGTRPAYPGRWAAAIVMMSAALMDLIDGTIVNVALPTIRRDLHASGTALEWVVGVAVAGSVFFPRVAGAGFTAAFEFAMPLAIGLFAACALLSLVLPRTAVPEAYE